MDFTLLNHFFSLSADEQLYIFLINFGWIPIAWVILWGAKEVWVYYINDKWGSQFKKIVLAIDVPRGIEQSLRSVENLFTYLGGAHSSSNLLETYWEGRYQLSFSFEIVSIGGYTQFLIRTPSHFRDLVESAVYSQFPDAEITEVDDYTKDMPTRFPDDTWEMWGSEFIQVKNSAYPILTYKNFESPIGGKPETQFKDPMASLMTLFSSLREGEQAWYQILVKPIDVKDWTEIGEKEISKILKEKIVVKVSGISKVFKEIKDLFDEFTRQAFSFMTGSFEEKEAQDNSLRMMNLKPREKKQVEAIQEKTSKLGFECKMRYIYIAKKEIMNKPKGVGGFVGYIKQFFDVDINNLKPDMDKTATTANYFNIEKRTNAKKRKLMQGYKDRDSTLGRKTGIFNVEELATLWHFPVEAVVKAPLIQKAPGRKSEPPMTLPYGETKVDLSTFEDNENIFTEIDLDRSDKKTQGEKNKGGELRSEIKSSGLEKQKEKRGEKEDIFQDENIFEKEVLENTKRPEAKKTVQEGSPPGNLPFV